MSRRVTALAAATAIALPLVVVPSATAADATTYYSTKQPYSPAASISSYSKAPAGFTQIYTTSVDRHGSRGLSSFKLAWPVQLQVRRPCAANAGGRR